MRGHMRGASVKRSLVLLLILCLLTGTCLPAAAAEEAPLDAAWNRVLYAVHGREPETDLSDLNVYLEEVRAKLRELYNRPELFYFDNYVVWSNPSTGKVSRVEFHYREEYGEAEVAAFEAAVERVVDTVLPYGASRMQAALLFHDYLAVNVAYDYDNYMAGTVPPVSYTAYGALVLGKAVCQGYTQAYRALLEYCGIPSAYVSSDEMDHGWAMIQLGENWYHVDVTWDDPTPDAPGRVRHRYFLLSDSAISDEEHRHYGWEAEHVCEDTAFDTDTFWEELNAPVPFTDGDTYWFLRENGEYTDQSLTLYRRSWKTGDYEAVDTVWDYWPVWSAPDSYWMDAYSGLVLWDNRLFYNDKQNVYAYDPAAGVREIAYTYGGGDGYLFGLTGAGDSLYALVKREPNEEGTLLSLELERKTVSNPFTDVPRWTYYHDAVLWAFTNNVTTGTSETEFSPRNTCTRGQVVTFLWRAMGKPAPETGENPFGDVSEKAYYRDAVLWAVEQGITNGTGTDPATGKAVFSPNAECSYAHILTFLWRTLTGKTASSYGSWYSEPLDWAGGGGLLPDTAPGEEPDRVTEYCPRCDVVTYLWRVLAQG